MLSIKSTSPLALTIACALSLGAAPPPAAAQTSGNLKCNGCVSSKDVKNNGLKSKDIKDGQVKTVDLGVNAVTSDKIAPDAVGTSEVASESLTAADLQNESGADFADGNQFEEVTSVDEVVRSVVISAPTAGVVTVVAAGMFSYGVGGGSGRCSVSTGNTVDNPQAIFTSGPDGATFDPFAATRGFEVSAGANTFNLVCRASSGTVFILNSQMIAQFDPTRY